MALIPRSDITRNITNSKNVQVLGQRLGDVLPDIWRDQALVPWGGGFTDPHEPRVDWIRSFWAFLVESECEDISLFESWPVIPATTGGDMPVLVSARHRDCVLRLKYEYTASNASQQARGRRGSMKPVKPTGRSAMVLGILTKIGVPLLNVKFATPSSLPKLDIMWQSVGLRAFEAPTALRILLACVDSLSLDVGALLLPEDRDALLEYWQASDLTPEDLQLLKRLPLFEKERQVTGASEQQQRMFVEISSATWHMLPEDIPASDLRGEFLEHKSSVADIYERLGVQPLTRETFYTSFIFAEMQQGTLSLQEFGRHLYDISLHFDQLVARSPAFKDALMAVAFVPMAQGGALVRPHECFDPRNPLFVQFFSDSLPSKIPPRGWGTHVQTEWLNFLEKVGMTCEFSPSVFIDCARQVSQEAREQDVAQRPAAQVASLRSRASRLGRYLIDEFESLKAELGGECEEAQRFFEELSQLALAEPMKPLFENPASPANLAATNAVLVPYAGTFYAPRGTTRLAYNLSWSHGCVAKTPSGVYYIKLEFYRLMRMTPVPVGIAIDHLLFVAQKLSDAQKVAWGWYRTQDAVEDIYTFLGEHVGVNEVATTTIRDRLSHCRCLLLDRRASATSSFVGVSTAAIGSVSGATTASAMGPPQFIDAGSVFLGVETDSPPFVYHQLNLVRAARAPRFLALLGVTESPSPLAIVEWLEAIARGDHAHDMGAEEQLDAVLNLLTIYVEADPQSSPELEQAWPRLLLPDKGGELRPVSETLLDDAPWLHDRIHTDKVPLCHSRLEIETAGKLGVVGLSTSVNECLQPGFEVTPVENQLLTVRPQSHA